MAAKKYFTLAQANATLPLVRRIVQDVTELARTLRARQQRLTNLADSSQPAAEAPHREELEAALEQGVRRMKDFVGELTQLGVLLKDYIKGLVDFPSLRDGREVYLCWHPGEATVEHWHEIDAGFTGRQKLLVEAPAE